MPTGYEGWGKLGDMIAGGPGDRAEANRSKYMGEASDAAFKYNRAAKERSDALIRAANLSHFEELPGAVAGVYKDPAQAALNLAILGSAATPNANNLGKFQTPGYTALVAEQQDALAKGDYKRMNAVGAVLGGKSFEPVRVAQGNLMPSGVPMDDPGFVVQPLPQTAAGIEQKHILGNAATTRANAYADKQHAPPKIKRSKIAERAATLDEDLGYIEQEIGHPLSASQRADYLQGKAIKLDPADKKPRLGDAPPAASIDAAPVVSEGYQSFDDVPAEARARLQEGVKTTFGNGQVWTLIHGQPTRVK